MDALTQAQVDALQAIWSAENIDDDSYEDDWKRGFNFAAREIRDLTQVGADSKAIKGRYDYIDLNDERWCDDWERGGYVVYRYVDQALAA